MKNKIIVVLMFILSAFLVGCNSPQERVDYQRKPYVVTIENCEYFYVQVRDGYVLTHKGNCKNPIHTK